MQTKLNIGENHCLPAINEDVIDIKGVYAYPGFYMSDYVFLKIFLLQQWKTTIIIYSQYLKS